jgi:uncharacterized membrane protein YfhO
MEKEQKLTRKKYYSIYSIVFIALFFLCFLIYLLHYHKSFFRFSDGFNQHYLSFLYLGRWGRTLVRNIFISHKFSVPLWNVAIGYGADIPTTFAAYLWDPFNWISFVIPSRYAEIGYAVMITAKFYACGIAFSVFARSRKHSDYAVLCGAVIYTFSAVGYVGFYQSFFINPLIIFPLLILGVDQLIENQNGKVYTIVLAISFATYFYFAYMMCILVVLYFIIKAFDEKRIRRDESQSFIRLIGKFILFSLIALGISAMSLLPSLIVMLQAGRLKLHHYLPLIFNKSYYIGMFSGFTTGFNMLGRDCNIGWGAIALICVVLLFTYPRKYKRIKLEFILMTAGLLIPFVGHVMNGFNYTANRWVWAYSFLVAYIVTLIVPQLKELSIKKIIILTSSAAAYLLVVYFLNHKTFIKPFQITAVLFMIILGLSSIYSFKPSLKWYRLIICAVSSLCVVCLAYYAFDGKMDNGFAGNTEAGQAFSIANQSDGMPLLNKINMSDGTRFDTYGLESVNNASWLYGVSGLNFYVSVYNNNIDQFHDAIGLKRTFSYMYKGLDRRSELEALAGVNHYFVNGNNISKPVTYDKIEAAEQINNTPVYSMTPQKKTSMFYLFDHTMSTKTFYQASSIVRQQLLLQACVLDKSSDHYKASQIENNQVKYKKKSLHGVKIQKGKFAVTEAGGQVELDFAPQHQTELYVYLNGIKYKNGEAGDYALTFQGYRDDQPISNLFSYNKGTTEYNHMYAGISNQLLCLGTTDNVNRIVITFDQPGIYSIKNIKILPRSIYNIKSNIDRLNTHVKNVYFKDNFFGCDVNLKQTKRLFTSVPYSTGWRAYDNGKKIRIDKTDVAFMSIKLAKGKHHIQFVYRTPGLYEGLIISALSIFLFCYFVRKRNET